MDDKPLTSFPAHGGEKLFMRKGLNLTRLHFLYSSCKFFVIRSHRRVFQRIQQVTHQACLFFHRESINLFLNFQESGH